MKKLFLILGILVLTGCGNPKSDTIVNQCLRTELVQQCLKALPAGPQATKYNDWDEVVSQCQTGAYYQALRKRAFVPEECQAG